MVTSSSENRLAHNPWLDLVRSLAIILVLLRHGQRALSGSESTSSSWEIFFLNGWVGVDLFFVLSGYLICDHLLRSGIHKPDYSLTSYLVSRTLRIVPAYVAVLILVVIGAFPGFSVDDRALDARIAYHLLFLQDYLPSNINVPFWSLGVEVKFYLLAPILLSVLIWRSTAPWWLAILIALAAISVVARATHFAHHAPLAGYEQFFMLLRSPFHVCWEPLLIGVAVAMAQHHGRLRASARWGGILMGGALAISGLMFSSHEFMATISWFDAVFQPILIAALAGASVLAAVMLRTTSLPFSKPTGYLAQWSYALYLVHYPLIPIAMTLSSGGKALPIFWAAYIGLSLLMAILIHRCVELPFLAMRNILLARTPRRIASR